MDILGQDYIKFQTMKNLVFTIAVGDAYQKMAKSTHPSIKAYAEKIGADFFSLDTSTATTPHWEKFNQIFTLLNRYERIIYLDTDIIVRDDCPNLFDLVPKGDLGLFNEMPFTDRRDLSLIESCKDYGLILNNWDGKYYNTGVMVISRQHKQLFKKPEREIFNFYEQGYFNANLAKVLESVGNEMSVFNLSHYYNRMACMDKFTGEERFASYIIHYAGFPNMEFILSLIPEDLKKWANSAPAYQFQRHLLIDVQGGLGDQVCAEPVLRFMKEKVYPNADIKVLTHFPTLFKHLNLPVFRHGEFKREPDIPYYSVNSLPGPDTMMWQCVSHLLCHPVDFIAMALLRRTLPNEDKQIRLKVDLSGLAEVMDVVGTRQLSELVLVHPGKHWESKTFPAQWWQKVIDQIQAAGRTVCLIGADEKSRGVLDVAAREGMIDTRNLLSLDGLIALIASAKVLVSNDSAPIHLAGAFDNYIVLIPTCKHPDHLLPYRQKIQYHKAIALYKKFMGDDYNSQPTELYGSLGDKVKGDYLDYLPEPAEVAAQVEKAFEEEK